MSKMRMFDGVDVAKNFSDITGKGYENSLIELSRWDRPSVTDGMGNLDATAFRDIARNNFADDSSINKSISRMTGCSAESLCVKYEIK